MHDHLRPPPLRALIVDDEKPARLRVRELLAARGDIEIAECANGVDAIATMHDRPPDLLFLDVQMPELDGFSVLRQMPSGRMPLTIFITAYDRYAVHAFDAHALDYLLKPFTDERFEIALSRALSHLRARQQDDVVRRMLALLHTTDGRGGDGRGGDGRGGDGRGSDRGRAGNERSGGDGGRNGEAGRGGDVARSADVRRDGGGTGVEPSAASPPVSTPPALDRLAVRANRRVLFLRPEEIDWVEAAGVYVYLHVGEDKYLHRTSLTALETRLANAGFVRIHRSAIVNFARIRELSPRTHGEFGVMLTDGSRLRLTRNFRARLEERLGHAL